MTASLFLTAPSLQQEGIAHGFFTRRGGVSTGPYASLNASLSGGDNADSVATNRARAAEALGFLPERLFGLHQTHGIDVAVLEGTGWPVDARPSADAVVSRDPGAALAIVTADCAPVLFVDPVARVVGAAHAGWRGAVAGVMEATIAAMQKLGAEPQRIRAAIGPCIHQPSYEVGTDLREAVLAASADAARFFAAGRDDSHWQFDLPGYCMARLQAAGVAEATTSPADTLADEDGFFSHRRRTLGTGGPIGHQVSIIGLLAAHAGQTA